MEQKNLGSEKMLGSKELGFENNFKSEKKLGSVKIWIPKKILIRK